MLSWPAFLRGAQAVWAAALSVFAFGVGFGVAAHSAGLGAATAGAMSAIVFAGGAQFAALELWRAPIPWVALVVATLAVNVRHVVLGAALHNWRR